MENEIKEYDKIKYSDKDVWWVTIKVVIACFVVLGIYYRFITVESDQIDITKDIENIYNKIEEVKNDLKQNIDENADNQRLRLDTKTNRNKGYIDKLSEDIEILKLPNSDVKQ